MIEDFQEQQRRKLTRARSFMDFTMGGILFLVGLFFISYRYMGVKLMDREPADIDFMIGGLFVLYGAWRMYRGYKKDYYK